MGQQQRRKTMKKRRTGGAKIGEGATGSVYRPALPCIEGTKYSTDEYVSKVVEFTTAEREFSASEYIKNAIPSYNKYFCLVEHYCQFEPTNNINTGPPTEFRDYLSISPFCGEAVSYVLRKENITESIFIGILFYTITLIEGIRRLHDVNVIHGDIHIGNILYDSKTRKLRLIDFEAAYSPETDEQFIKGEYNDLALLYDSVYTICDIIVKSRKLHTSEPIKRWMSEQLNTKKPILGTNLVSAVDDINNKLNEFVEMIYNNYD